LFRSMTAFGRGQSHGQNEDYLVEIHSVNSRRLEIVINIPVGLTEFDPRLRKLIAGSISRGRVAVSISCQPVPNRGEALRLDTEMARDIKRAYDDLMKSLGYEGQVSFSLIASRHDLLTPVKPPADPEVRWAGLKAAAEKALAQLLAMKEAEAKNLRGDFEEDLADLEQMVASIAELAPASLETRKEILQTRITEASPDLDDNQDRFAREIAILADKLDISEELTRLKSHIAQFRSLLEDVEPCGRTIDFVIQEMNREINTIGAKANDLMISRLVVRGKTELQKLREQAQNIE